MTSDIHKFYYTCNFKTSQFSSETMKNASIESESRPSDINTIKNSNDIFQSNNQRFQNRHTNRFFRAQQPYET